MSELSEAVATFGQSGLLIGNNVSTEILQSKDLSVDSLAAELLFVTNLHVNNEMKFDENNVNISCQAAPGNIQLGADLGVPTTGEKNIKIGQQAGQAITTGVSNVIIGETAGVNLLDGNENISIGTAAGAATDGFGSYNVCLGSSAGTLLMGSNSVAIGVEALGTNGGSSNIGLGYISGSNKDLNGSNNVLVGINTCNANQINANNIVIGSNAFLDGNYSNTIVLGTQCYASQGKSINIGRQSNPQPVNATYKNIVLGHAAGGGVSSSIIPGPYSSDKAAFTDPVEPVPLGGLYYSTDSGQPTLCICLHTV